MRLNDDALTPPRKPCWRDLHLLTAAPGALLPAAQVRFMSLKQLRRCCREIDATHPRFREETPLVLQYEAERRRRLSGKLRKTTSTASRVA